MSFDLTRVSLETIKTYRPGSMRGVAELLTELGLASAAQEQMWVVALDSVNQVRTITPVAIGTYHESYVALPTILSPVFLSAVDRFIVAHNHPNSRITPTVADLDLTARIQAAAVVCDLSFDDHLIVAPGGKWQSLRALGHLREAA